MDFCIYDDIVDIIQIIDKELLHFKLLKSGQILHVDKTCFPRPGHIFKWLHFYNCQCSFIVMKNFRTIQIINTAT